MAADPREQDSTMSQTPSVGRQVHFYLNDDMVVSPAEIINTQETTNLEVLNTHQPKAPDGSYVWTGDVLAKVKDSDAGRIRIEAPDDADNVDLLVDGLVKSYRVYNAPYSDVPKAGHWSWPPRI